jgi:hypothetical protein
VNTGEILRSRYCAHTPARHLHICQWYNLPVQNHTGVQFLKSTATGKKKRGPKRESDPAGSFVRPVQARQEMVMLVTMAHSFCAGPLSPVCPQHRATHNPNPFSTPCEYLAPGPAAALPAAPTVGVCWRWVMEGHCLAAPPAHQETDQASSESIQSWSRLACDSCCCPLY